MPLASLVVLARHGLMGAASDALAFVTKVKKGRNEFHTDRPGKACVVKYSRPSHGFHS